MNLELVRIFSVGKLPATSSTYVAEAEMNRQTMQDPERVYSGGFLIA